MMAMVGNPAHRSTAGVKDGPEDKELLDELIELESAMREQAMVRDRYAKSSQRHKKESNAQNLETRQREKNHADDSQYMNKDEKEEHRAFAGFGFPERPFPRPSYLRSTLAHLASVT
jgi:hypothetical protein